MSKITIIGAGAWGTTLAILLAQNDHEITLWSYETEVIENIKKFKENKKYLPGFMLHQNISAEEDLKMAAKSSQTIIYSTPTQFMRKTVKESIGSFDGEIIMSAVKGIEVSTLKFPSEIISEFTKKPVAALSGPNLAKEIAKGLPATSVIASKDEKTSKELQTLFKKCQTFRIYTSDDLLGVQIGGALKNIIAIAAGASEEKQLGDNAKAALIIRGISEITKLGIALGAKRETFSGLSGLGDLIATCQSGLSRNHSVGVKLAKGEKLSSILSSLKQVAEGVETTKAAIKLAQKYKVEMPITYEINEILFNNKRIDEA
ncbi:glycerol-3-phosphate dehydrogenase, partial [candidate division WOR-1 bacterium RIFOXYD2_FULL_36_8]